MYWLLSNKTFLYPMDPKIDKLIFPNKFCGGDIGTVTLRIAHQFPHLQSSENPCFTNICRSYKVDGNQKSGEKKPVDRVNIPSWEGFSTIPGGCLGFLNHLHLPPSKYFHVPTKSKELRPIKKDLQCIIFLNRTPESYPMIYPISQQHPFQPLHLAINIAMPSLVTPQHHHHP